MSQRASPHGSPSADRRNSDYFHTVAPWYANAQRPAYAVPGGSYAGTQLLVATSRRFPSYWIGDFLRYDTLSDAAFAASPLMR